MFKNKIFASQQNRTNKYNFVRVNIKYLATKTVVADIPEEIKIRTQIGKCLYAPTDVLTPKILF